jgi:hypothetical protein
MKTSRFNVEENSTKAADDLAPGGRALNAGRPRPLYFTPRITGMALALAFGSPSFALPNTDPGDPGEPRPQNVTVEGTLTFQGCSPAPGDVTVRIANPPRAGHPSSGMRYSIVVGTTDQNLPSQVTVRPQVASSVCGSGVFSPASRTVAPGARGVNFSYQAPVAKRFTIPVDSFILFANGFLSNVGLHLNNDAGQAGHENQTSHITINGVTSAFDIPVAKKDLPFPLPGSGLFYVRNMNKDDADLSQVGNGNAFNVRLHFEENGIEVKGYHSSLGDVAMPDFQMSDINVNTAAALRVRRAKLGVAFSNAHLDAGIASTGACNVFGLDWCDVLFGTSGDVRQNFERATLTQLQGTTIQAALEKNLAEALASFGITGPIGTVVVQNGQIVITTLCTNGPLSNLCGGVALP